MRRNNGPDCNCIRCTMARGRPVVLEIKDLDPMSVLGV